MNSKKLPLLALILVVAASLAGGLLHRQKRTTASERDAQADITDFFEQSLHAVEENYSGDLDLERVSKASIQGMLHQLDPHSSFFTKNEFDDLQTEQSSRFYGIGVTIKKLNGRVFIASTIPGGPAYRAGLRYGDAVTSIDSLSAEDWSGEQVMQRVRGVKGDPVEIKVERPGVSHTITVRVIRDEVKLPTVRNAFMIPPTGVGYISLTGFLAKTDDELNDAIARLKPAGLHQLILDLRGNPGGLLDQAIKVAGRFLSSGMRVLEVRGRDEPSSDRVYDVPPNNEPEQMPMVILIDKRTASASEVVAGALQDHDRALIIGETSFGKGLVQGVYKLWGGTGLTLTTARYYTPSGRSIQRDYSTISFYDYYQNRDEALHKVASAGNAFHTDLGQDVYGGGGIAPKIELKQPEASRVQGQLYSAIFDFVRQLVNGQINGLREYRVTETQRKTNLSADDIDRFPIGERLLTAFRQYIADKPRFNLSEEKLAANQDYLRGWLRREILTAAYGAEAGEETYLLEDPLVKKAVEKLPEARQLAENARHSRGEQ